MHYSLDFNPHNLMHHSGQWDELSLFFLEAFLDGLLDTLKKKYSDFDFDKSEISDQLLDWCKHNPAAIPEALSQKVTAALEHVNSKKAQDFISTIDKLSQTIHDTTKNSYLYDGKEHRLFTGEGKKHIEAYVYLTVNIKGLEQFITFGNDCLLNPYTRVIHDAVISLYNGGNKHITPNLIYSFLNGNKPTRHVPEDTRKEICEAMRKMMFTPIRIDAKEEAKAFGISEFTYEGYLLPMTYTLAVINGIKTECWQILSIPPLLAFAERKDQIARCKTEALDTGLRTTPANLILTHYLLDRILILKNEAKRKKDKSTVNHVIAYETLYAYLQVNAPTEATLRSKKRFIRDTVKKILDGWRKNGLILDYNEVIKGTEITGLYIDL